MQLTVLIDNNSLVGSYFVAEPGLSMLIEEANSRILFDAGYSDGFLTNARRLGTDLLNLDWIVLSHGHFDHTWGLDALLRHRFESLSQKMDVSRPTLLAHPLAFDSKSLDNEPEIGMLLSREKLARHMDIQEQSVPSWLTDRLVALGQIERNFAFEPTTPLGCRISDNGPCDDALPDDTALAYVGDQGLVVIAGCAHSGICNTVEQARRVTGEARVHAILGGLHLLDASKERLDSTAAYLADLNLDALYCCHCTDLQAKIHLAKHCPVREVGSGLRLTF